MRARAKLLFRIAEQRTSNAMAAYRARVAGEVDKIARLRELRLAAEAQAAGEPKAKRKPGGKARCDVPGTIERL